MPKKNKHPINNTKIDNIDRAIVENLLMDGRISLSELAKRVRISRGMLAKRIKNMIEKRVIQKFTVLVSREYFRKPLPVFFDVTINPQHIEDIAEKLSQHDDIFVVYQMSGRSSLHVHGYFEDINEVYGFIHNYIETLTGIQNVSTKFLLKKFKVEFI